MAESIARHDATDVIEPLSAGLTPLGFLPTLTTQTLIDNECPIDDLISTPITRDVWDAADIVINMSGIPKEQAFPDYQKVEDWDVQDPYGADPAVYQNTYDDIRRRIALLAYRVRNTVSEQSVKK